MENFDFPIKNFKWNFANLFEIQVETLQFYHVELKLTFANFKYKLLVLQFKTNSYFN